MFGVADETGVLKYGECFIQYSVLDSSYTDQQEFKVVTGNCCFVSKKFDVRFLFLKVV